MSKEYKIARPLKGIRLKCLDCSGWSSQKVAKCVHKACILYELRFGRKPKGRHYSAISAREYEKRVLDA